MIAHAADVAADGAGIQAGLFGDVLGSDPFGQDITERKQAEERLRIMATTDELTGLWNSRHFMDHLRWEVERGGGEGLMERNCFLTKTPRSSKIRHQGVRDGKKL
ncbi:GGDEF domain-containing protein [Desulfonatronum sp. SC1]|uniref:GGDEF domain-containing protein n=1 Tax=Desulfonatronum sp. SC1 TaxID=2109626 RepID=UPI000D30FE4C|nr:GGDEF domain-containing protein [Desulfonatronum sp. SC1]PTN35346.1 hypothetical protein C6366_11425 [Desulfonatronum sp. SC1]